MDVSEMVRLVHDLTAGELERLIAIAEQEQRNRERAGLRRLQAALDV